MELTELKRIYVREMRLKTRSTQTLNHYWSCINKFHLENNRVYRMSKSEIKDYMSEFRVRYSDSYYNVMGSALIVLFEKVYNQPEKMKWFESVSVERKYHDIIPVSDFIQMVKNAKNVKHKFMLMFLYSTGVRETEFINIKLSDINYEDDLVFIRSLKKGKNRHVPLKPMCIDYLNVYLRKYKPVEYLLNGQEIGSQYTASSMLKVVKNVSFGKYTVHCFRHTYASNLIEHENVFRTKDMLGHKTLESTLFYYHIPKNKLKNMYNPLDEINSRI